MDEKFRNGLLISSRLIAAFLVIGIFWVGYVQMTYAQDVVKLKAEYGPDAYCYLCGLESARTCGCNYEMDTLVNTPSFDRKGYLERIANSNVNQCEDRNKEPELPNISF